MLTNELQVLHGQPSMVAYNMEFMESCFQLKAHPNWHKWDMLDESFLDKQVSEMKLGDLQKLVYELIWAPSFGDVLEAMYDRMIAWQHKKFKDDCAIMETKTLTTHRQVHEAWMAYQLCSLHVHVLGENRTTLL
jgi:hypothetical protein